MCNVELICFCETTILYSLDTFFIKKFYILLIIMKINLILLLHLNALCNCFYSRLFNAFLHIFCIVRKVFLSRFARNLIFLIHCLDSSRLCVLFRSHSLFFFFLIYNCILSYQHRSYICSYCFKKYFLFLDFFNHFQHLRFFFCKIFCLSRVII